jgi:hypothetical protein
LLDAGMKHLSRRGVFVGETLHFKMLISMNYKYVIIRGTQKKGYDVFKFVPKHHAQ